MGKWNPTTRAIFFEVEKLRERAQALLEQCRARGMDVEAEDLETILRGLTNPNMEKYEIKDNAATIIRTAEAIAIRDMENPLAFVSEPSHPEFCPYCESDDLAFAEIDDTEHLCRTCGHTWEVEDVEDEAAQ